MKRHVAWVALAAGCMGCTGCRSQEVEGMHEKEPVEMSSKEQVREGRAGHGSGEIAFEVHGEGQPALVFVHGWAAHRGHWHRQLAVDDGRQRVALDLLGHGESDKPEEGYDMDTLAGGVIAVLDELAIERAVLVGHSNGVPVVRQVYRRAPERVQAIVAVDGALRQEIAPAMAKWFQDTLARPDAESFVVSMAEQTPRGSLSEEDHELVKRGVRDTPLRVHRGGLASLLDERTWVEDAIDVPLLVLRPRPIDEDERAFLRRLNPEVRVESWSGVSHFLFLEEPERFEILLGEFLGEL